MTRLILDNVSKTFGGVSAVSNLSMLIEPGKVTGLIGPNGAGKTTVVNLITGFLKVSSGHIRLDDQDITEKSPASIARSNVSRTFQNIRLLKDASVLDNVAVGFHRHEQTSLLANIVGFPSVWKERKLFHEQAFALLKRFGIERLSLTSAGALSYGDQRRVEIMRALAMSPSILLLDEPVAGMTDVEAYQLADIFRQLVDDGISILLIEHNIRFVLRVCDILYVIAFGSLIAKGAGKDVVSKPEVIDAYLGA